MSDEDQAPPLPSETVATSVGLQLFRCDRYNVRLTAKACAANYALRNTRSRNDCDGCPIGQKNADALDQEPSDATDIFHTNTSYWGSRKHLPSKSKAPEVEKVEEPPPPPTPSVPEEVPHKECLCGLVFRPSTASQVYCTPTCVARPREKPAQKSDAVTRMSDVRTSGRGKRGPQGDPRTERLRMNFTQSEMETLIEASAGDHPSSFVRRVANEEALRQLDRVRRIVGAIVLLSDGSYWMIGHESMIAMSSEDIRKEALSAFDDAEMSNVVGVQKFEVRVPVLLHGEVLERCDVEQS